MGDRIYSVDAPAIALTAATAKTVLEINAGTTIDFDLVAIEIGFDASTPGVGIKGELIRFTTTGTGTAYTPLKYNVGAQRAAQCTAKINDTVEPTSVTVIATRTIPNTSLYPYQWPLGRELYIPPSTGLGLRLTAPAGVNVSANAQFNE